MKSLKVTLFVAAAALLSFATADMLSFDADVAHSNVRFTIKHMGISDFNGNFGKFDTKMTATKEDLSDATIEFSADAASINTGIEKRDEHLKAADFLDAAKYEKITFKSTSFKKVKGNNYTVVGELSLHGVTKEVKLNAEKIGTTENPQSGKSITGFKITGQIKRSDFGVATGFPTQMLSDEIQVIADLELVKA